MKNNSIFLVLLTFFLGISGLEAGDSAYFTDLGFSQDGKFYMFAQYGVNSQTLRPWTEIIAVDVQKNDYVPNGRILYTHDRPVIAGQDGTGVMYGIISQNFELARRYGINFSRQGKPLYIAFAGDPALEGKAITFRDFESNSRYRAILNETVSGINDKAASSFTIQVEIINKDSLQRNVNVGTPQIRRPLIFANRIWQVLVSPEGNSLIFVIEMKRYSKDGPDIRYMVEALSLN